MPSRKHVTIRQNATDIGVAAELVQVLEEITADGAIADAEVHKLRDWLDLADSDAPAFVLLRETIALILSDGQISEIERSALHKTVERVLPAELRQASKARRTALKALEIEKAREIAIEDKRLKREERDRVSQQARLNVMVMGVGHDGRAELIDKYLQVNQPVFLVREIGNPFDSNAILVRISQGHIGYVPRDHAVEIAPMLDRGFRQLAYCSKILEGKQFPIPVIQASLYRPDSDIGVETPQPFQYVAHVPQAGRGCGCCAGVALMVAAGIGLLAVLIVS